MALVGPPKFNQQQNAWFQGVIWVICVTLACTRSLNASPASFQPLSLGDKLAPFLLSFLLFSFLPFLGSRLCLCGHGGSLWCHLGWAVPFHAGGFAQIKVQIPDIHVIKKTGTVRLPRQSWALGIVIVMLLCPEWGKVLILVLRFTCSHVSSLLPRVLLFNLCLFVPLLQPGDAEADEALCVTRTQHLPHHTPPHVGHLAESGDRY